MLMKENWIIGDVLLLWTSEIVNNEQCLRRRQERLITAKPTWKFLKGSLYSCFISEVIYLHLADLLTLSYKRWCLEINWKTCSTCVKMCLHMEKQSSSFCSTLIIHQIWAPVTYFFFSILEKMLAGCCFIEALGCVVKYTKGRLPCSHGYLE